MIIKNAFFKASLAGGKVQDAMTEVQGLGCRLHH